MKKIEVTVKGRNGRIKFELAHDAYLVKLETAQAKGSTGIYGDYLEAIIRHLWKKAGLTPSDFRVHHSDERDALNRKNGGLEVKTGNGIIGYTRTETISADFCKLDRYVAYCAKPQLLETLDDVLDYVLIFTREEFIDFVATCGLKRKAGNFASGCKLGVNDDKLREANKQLARGHKLHDCICLQPTYLEARWTACQNGEYTTLRTFLEENA